MCLFRDSSCRSVFVDLMTIISPTREQFFSAVAFDIQTWLLCLHKSVRIVGGNSCGVVVSFGDLKNGLA